VGSEIRGKIGQHVALAFARCALSLKIGTFTVRRIKDNEDILLPYN
jgi:hypothetical protein